MTPLTLDLAGKKWPDLASKIPSVRFVKWAFFFRAKSDTAVLRQLFLNTLLINRENKLG